jgi:hypothetical protein
MSLDIWLTIGVDTGGPEPYEITLYDANYTHNVTPMWRKAGIYEALYESDGKQAGEILPMLRAGIVDMERKPNAYIALNPSNGWGSYETALPWLRKFTAACERHPKAVIGVWK